MIIKKALFVNVPLEYQGELLSNLANKFMDHEEEDQEEDGNQEEEEDQEDEDQGKEDPVDFYRATVNETCEYPSSVKWVSSLIGMGPAPRSEVSYFGG